MKAILIALALFCVAVPTFAQQGFLPVHGNGAPSTQTYVPDCSKYRLYNDDLTGTVWTASRQAGYPCGWVNSGGGGTPAQVQANLASLSSVLTAPWQTFFFTPGAANLAAAFTDLSSSGNNGTPGTSPYTPVRLSNGLISFAPTSTVPAYQVALPAAATAGWGAMMLGINVHELQGMDYHDTGSTASLQILSDASNDSLTYIPSEDTINLVKGATTYARSCYPLQGRNHIIWITNSTTTAPTFLIDGFPLCNVGTAGIAPAWSGAGMIGTSQPTPTFGYSATFDLFAFGTLPSTNIPSNAQMLIYSKNIENALNQNGIYIYHGPFNAQIVNCCDSMQQSVGTGNNRQGSIPFLGAQASGNVTYANPSVQGMTVGTIVGSGLSAWIFPVMDNDPSLSVFMSNVGVNDINAGTSGTTAEGNAENMCLLEWTRYQRPCVLGFLNSNGQMTAAHETQRELFNSTLLSNFNSGEAATNHVAALWQFGLDPVQQLAMQPNNAVPTAAEGFNATLSPDGQHYTTLGNSYTYGHYALAYHEAIGAAFGDDCIPIPITTAILNPTATSNYSGATAVIPIQHMTAGESVVKWGFSVTTAFAASGLTAATASLGDAVNSLPNEFTANQNLMVTTGFQALQSTANPLYYNGGTGDLTVYITLTGANISQLTGGSMQFTACIAKKP
jgi:hypothetical protein